jgi:hypothetical protein
MGTGRRYAAQEIDFGIANLQTDRRYAAQERKRLQDCKTARPLCGSREEGTKRLQDCKTARLQDNKKNFDRIEKYCIIVL